MNPIRLSALLSLLVAILVGCAAPKMSEFPYKGETRPKLSDDAPVVIFFRDEAERMLHDLPENKFSTQLISEMPDGAEELGIFRITLDPLHRWYQKHDYDLAIEKARSVGARGIVVKESALSVHVINIVWGAYYWD